MAPGELGTVTKIKTVETTLNLSSNPNKTLLSRYPVNIVFPQGYELISNTQSKSTTSDESDSHGRTNHKEYFKYKNQTTIFHTI